MKKLLAAFLAGLVCLSLVSCGKETQGETPPALQEGEEGQDTAGLGPVDGEEPKNARVELPFVFVEQTKEGSFRLLDKQTLQPVSDTVYDEVVCEIYPDETYSDKYITFRQGEYWGLLDGHGEVILPAETHCLNSISINTYEEVWPLIEVTKEGLVGAIDYEGNLVIEPIYAFLMMDVYNVPNTVFVLDGERWGAISLGENLAPSPVDYDQQPPEWIVAHEKSLRGQ